MLTTINPAESDWSAFVNKQYRANVLQLSEWGALKLQYGWRVHRVALTDDVGRIVAGAQILLRDLPARLGTLAYIPMGPYVTDLDQYPLLWQAIELELKQFRTAFLKVEPGHFPASNRPDYAGWGFRPAVQTVQPPNTILIDISGDDDTILARMNQGTRRKIRTGDKKDVRYYEASRADVAKFTKMMQTTGNRNEFGVHEPAYYELAYDLFVPKYASLILAGHEGDTLAGVFVFATGKHAVYLYGASSDVKRNLMGSYGVQWAGIQWAKARGCTSYDLWGIPDADEETLENEFQTRGDGLWGVYGFKRGWGGDVRRSMGTWDYVYNAPVYWMYRTYLNLRGDR